MPADAGGFGPETSFNVQEPVSHLRFGRGQAGRSRPPAAEPVESEPERPPHAELPEHIDAVGSAPVLDDLAIGHAADRYAPQAHRPAAVVAPCDPAGYDAVRLGDLILDPNAEVTVAEDELVSDLAMPSWPR